jgi:hypothetical protein
MRHTLLALAISLAACATQSAQGPGAQSALADNQGSDNDKLCEPTTVTGTNISRVVCRTRAEKQAEIDAARAWRDRTQPDPTYSDASGK